MQPFLAINGDYNTFWTLTPKTIQVFFKAYNMKRQEEIKMAWIQGRYFQQALASTVLVSALADRNVVRHMAEYPEMPTFENGKIAELDEDYQRTKVVMQLEKWMAHNNK
mgnify:FL=1